MHQNTDFPNHLGTIKFVRIILDCKTVHIFAYSSRQNRGAEVDGRVRLVRFARVRLLRYNKPTLRPTVLQSRIILVKV